MHWRIIISILISIANISAYIAIGGSPSSPWDRDATFDPTTGWPTRDFGMVLSTAAIGMGGTYLLNAQGNAQVTVYGGSSAGRIANKMYNASTNTLSASLIIPQGATQIMLSFINTSGPGLQNISVLQPGYDLTSKSNITNLMLTHLSRFSIIRFMDWTSRNTNLEVNWNETTPLNWLQYTPSKRNPCKIIPFIANQLNSNVDIWINIPYGATDDYVLNVVQLMLNQLNPTINIYVEFSNELWNFIFAQATTNLKAANDSVLNQDDLLRLAYDNTDQCVNPTIIIQGSDYFNKLYGPPSTFLHDIAIAPDFDLSQYKTCIQTFLLERGWSQRVPVDVHAVYAAWYGLAVHDYEGGLDTAAGCEGCSLSAKINATRDNRMINLCVSFLNGWYRYGFQPLNWWVTGAAQITTYGSWNLLEDMRQETLMDTTAMFNSSSPVAQLLRPSSKLKAIDQIRQRNTAVFQPTPSFQFNINQTIVPSIVTLRLRNIRNGYSIRRFDVVSTTTHSI
ncbi:unnamed protein product [Rotaria sordida]|uniref:Glycoside hydrolase family 30 protein n=1 Tax=Rotaria sordida TaxID=392033 RepID=A0A819FJE5_9BILA|nr:unnamed protein product [Rotaria sordida]CAF3869235.1 unnamed protein product [Rotaria sordida]